MAPIPLVIYGAGGFAREVAWLAQMCREGEKSYQVLCFVDDNQRLHGACVNSIPVMGLDEARSRFAEARMVCAVGAPQTRQRLTQAATNAGFDFATLVHPRVERSPWVEIGQGCVVCANAVLTVNVVLGAHVHVNPSCTLGHDVAVGDYSTLAPGAHVSGCVSIGRRVWVGAGAVIINGNSEEPVLIGDDVVIGAGACVIRSVPAGQTVVGVPARALARER